MVVDLEEEIANISVFFNIAKKCLYWGAEDVQSDLDLCDSFVTRQMIKQLTVVSLADSSSKMYSMYMCTCTQSHTQTQSSLRQKQSDQ